MDEYMTVGELIEKLEGMDPDAIVFVDSTGSGETDLTSLYSVKELDYTAVCKHYRSGKYYSDPDLSDSYVVLNGFWQMESYANA